MNNKDFDRFVKTSLEKDTYPVSNDLWNKIENNLTSKKSNKPIWILRIAAMLVLSFGVGYYIFNQHVSNHQIPQLQHDISIDTKPIMIPQPNQPLVAIKPIITKTRHQTSNNKKGVILNKTSTVTVLIDSLTVNKKELTAYNKIKVQISNNTSKDIIALNVNLPDMQYNISIDANDLLNILENEIEHEREPTLREKLSKTIKNTLTNKYAVINN